MKSFQQRQRQLTDYLRDPEAHRGPEDVESRRLAIYRELFYKNIEGFISGGFPVCRSLFDGAAWQCLVRDFMRVHRCKSPYFLQIAEEFLHYLCNERQAEDDPVFLAALAHYEWVELALDVAEQQLPPPSRLPESLLEAYLQRSPLAWSLAYPFAVQRISADYQPQALDAQPTYLLVYRNRRDEVEFMEINAVTARLLELLDNPARPRDVLAVLAAELGMAEKALTEFAEPLLTQLYNADVLYLSGDSDGAVEHGCY